MDWEKLKVFHAAAEAGSFTHAGEALNISQSAVSRQVSALERELNAPLFHRHARGLVLTEQGELLYRTSQEVFMKLATAEILLADTKAKPSGELKVTTTTALGASWLTPRLGEFLRLYPDIKLQLILDDDERNLTMREADVAIWFQQPTQGDLIQRKLFTVHFHVYASPAYITAHGAPQALSELNRHRILTYGGAAPASIKDINWLESAGCEGRTSREPVLRINSLYALKQACLSGAGLAVLPDYMARDEPRLVSVLKSAEVPQLNTYLVFPEEIRDSKRAQVFRDFLLAKAREWSF
jgi:DNA-binding transcriptional LysR family regulator